MLFEDGVLSKVDQNVTIDKIIIHPNFDYDYNDYNDETEELYEWLLFDAAIIKLKSPLKFGIDVKAACLPEPNFEPEKNGESAIESGWGVKSEVCLLHDIKDKDIDECKSVGNM